jgi:hypothetical protein
MAALLPAKRDPALSCRINHLRGTLVWPTCGRPAGCWGMLDGCRCAMLWQTQVCHVVIRTQALKKSVVNTDSVQLPAGQPRTAGAAVARAASGRKPSAAAAMPRKASAAAARPARPAAAGTLASKAPGMEPQARDAQAVDARTQTQLPAQALHAKARPDSECC